MISTLISFIMIIAIIVGFLYMLTHPSSLFDFIKYAISLLFDSISKAISALIT